MTKEDKGRLIEYIRENATKYSIEVYDDEDAEYKYPTGTIFKELYELIEKYPETEATDNDYEVMFNNCMKKLEVSRAEVRDYAMKLEKLESKIRRMEIDRARFDGALTMIETIFGHEILFGKFAKGVV